MEQSLAWEANSFTGSSKISWTLWKPEFRYRTYNSPTCRYPESKAYVAAK